jgi:hypothetical protein
MSQFGMQMPGGRARRAGAPDVYTGIAFAAVAFLIAACVFVYMAASKVGKDGSAFGLQDTARGSESISLKTK